MKLPVLQPDLTYSRLVDWHLCKRLFAYRHRWDIHKPTAEARALEQGRWFHLAMAHLYLGGTLESLVAAVTRRAETEIERVSRSHLHPDLKEARIQQVERAADQAIVMASVFWQRNPPNPHLRPMLVEHDVRRQINGIACGGVVDLVLTNPEKGVCWIVDHKTISDDGQAYRETVSFDWQGLLYYALLNGQFTDAEGRNWPIVGFLFNVCRRPAIRRKQWQSMSEYIQECRDWYEGQAETPPMGEIYQRGELKGQRRPRWDHTDKAPLWRNSPPMFATGRLFDRTALRKLDQLIERAREDFRREPSLETAVQDGRLTGVCWNRYGAPCEYLELCAAGDGAMSAVLEKSYRIGEHDASEQP